MNRAQALEKARAARAALRGAESSVGVEAEGKRRRGASVVRVREDRRRGVVVVAAGLVVGLWLVWRWQDAAGTAAECTEDFDCDWPLQCVGGQCVPVACVDGTDCPDGTMCVDGACLDAYCDGVTPCPAGYYCLDGECVPAECTESSDCGPGERCLYGGACVPDPVLPPGEDGLDDLAYASGLPCGFYELQGSDISSTPLDGAAEIAAELVAAGVLAPAAAIAYSVAILALGHNLRFSTGWDAEYGDSMAEQLGDPDGGVGATRPWVALPCLEPTWEGPDAGSYLPQCDPGMVVSAIIFDEVMLDLRPHVENLTVPLWWTVAGYSAVVPGKGPPREDFYSTMAIRAAERLYGSWDESQGKDVWPGVVVAGVPPGTEICVLVRPSQGALFAAAVGLVQHYDEYR